MHVGAGAAKQTFAVHKDLLTKHSEFFKAAANGEWKEGRENVVSLGSYKPENFKLFCDFLYTGRIFMAREGDRSGDTDEEFIRTQSAWLMAQKLLSTSFKDALVDTLIAKCVEEKFYPNSLHRAVYASGSSKSGMRKLLVDFHIWGTGAKRIEKVGFELESAEFYYDIAVARNKRKSAAKIADAPFKEEDTCRYHEHVAEGKPCYETMF